MSSNAGDSPIEVSVVLLYKGQPWEKDPGQQAVNSRSRLQELGKYEAVEWALVKVRGKKSISIL